VLIPDLVLTEARVITVEKTAEAIQKARDALAQVDKRLPGAADFSSIKWPSRKDRQDALSATGFDHSIRSRTTPHAAGRPAWNASSPKSGSQVTVTRCSV
jgi:hypothetical protein